MDGRELPAMPIMLLVLAILAIAYRYYSAFLAARVAVLDDLRVTPAHRFSDGQNFHPTNKYVLFGHHFAAIAGAGPLIGPVLAIQFGYLPGLVWLVVGVCLAGAVQDMMILFASTRRDGQSLAGIVRQEMGPTAGWAATLAILFIVIIALAGLGIVVVKALGGERVPMIAGASLTPPADAGLVFRDAPGAPATRLVDVPPGAAYRWGAEEGQSLRFQEGFVMSVPATATESGDAGAAWVLPKDCQRIVPGSSWGMFTIACTIPIAILVGLYMNWFRKGRVAEASFWGAIAVLGATYLGSLIPGSPLESWFNLTGKQVIIAMAIYGFIAAVLPVWLLLGPRDYLSSFLKIGTVALLVLGVILVNPKLQAPPINAQFIHGGGPYFSGPVFPYVFICIMCGAISGFHALVSSGTTPKMLNKESDIRMIGYGAMLTEGLVGVVALIAAAALPNAMYYKINIELAQQPKYTQQLLALGVDLHGSHDESDELVVMEKNVQESLHGRTGGAVTLAVGMARIFTQAMPSFESMISFWYHFAIMFEALFILTTIDAGTRIGRFLVQELLGKVYEPWGRLNSVTGAALGTGFVVGGWGYFLWTGSVATIWPMFGIANQLLALIALCTVAMVLINMGRARYAWVAIAPMCFVLVTTSTAIYFEISRFVGLIRSEKWGMFQGALNIGLSLFLMGCALVIVVSAAIRVWQRSRSGNIG